MKYNCFPRTCFHRISKLVLGLHSLTCSSDTSDVCSFSDTTFCNMASFYNEELLVPHPTLKLEDLHLSVTAYSIYLQLLSISGGCLLCNLRLIILYCLGPTYHRQFLFTAWYLEIRNVIHKRCISKMQISLHKCKSVPCSTSLQKKFWNIQVKDLHLCYSTPLSTTNMAFQMDLHRLYHYVCPSMHLQEIDVI
jgi:hypothetical protein